MKNIKNIIIAFIGFFPVLTFAALDGVKGLLYDFSDILSLLEPIIIGLAFLYFFWGVSQFILHAGDQKLRDDGKRKMLWGVIALFVMLSIIGILHRVGDLIGVPVGSSGQPTLPGYSSGPF
jgi:hypothetical protein